MRKHDKWWVIGACIVIISLAVYNYFTNPDFWVFSATNGITLLVAVIVSFFLVQRKADKKNQIDALVKLLYAIQSIVGDKATYMITADTDPNTLTMRKRQLSNYVDILLKHADAFGISKEAAFISEKVEEYASIIGNHIDDLSFLSQSSKDLRRPLELIDTKIYEAIFNLYG